jgi:hypothetical protein
MLIEAITAFCLLAFINDADPSGKTIYPSGVKDCDTNFFNAPPSSKYPVVKIFLPLEDADGNIINQGIYSAVYLEDSNQIKLLEGDKPVALLNVKYSKLLSQPHSVESARIENLSENKVLFIYIKDNKELYSELFFKTN